MGIQTETTTIQIRLMLFASLRELAGHSEERLSLSGPQSVGSVRALLAARGDRWNKALLDSTRVRAALNQQLANEQTTLSDGDELAFFPPVTGG
jgi:molybdopterin synthase sulfur carrier subunit